MLNQSDSYTTSQSSFASIKNFISSSRLATVAEGGLIDKVFPGSLGFLSLQEFNKRDIRATDKIRKRFI
jgi:hypothetical protein